MDAPSLLLVVAAAMGLAAAYGPSSSNALDSDSLPDPEFYIHFPRTTEIGCYKGAKPPAGAKGVFFLLDRMLSHNHTCRFITYNMRDYQGTNDAYRFRRLITMYPEIVRPDRKLECSEGSDVPTAAEGADFEMSRNGRTRRCRMVPAFSLRSGLPDSGRPHESYKRLPGGQLLLRASFDTPRSHLQRRSAQKWEPGQGSSSQSTRDSLGHNVNHKHKLQRVPETRNLFDKVGKNGN